MDTPGKLPAGISFNRDWYVTAYPDVAAACLDPERHFFEYGLSEGRLPCAEAEVIRASGLLDINYYVMNSEDVRRAGLDPIDHFVRYGSGEGRRPNPYFDPPWYMRHHKTSHFMGAVAHYTLIGEALGMRPGLLFDPLWYRETYDIAEGTNALGHYLANRHTQNFSPMPWFDARFYADRNRRVLRAGRDPFAHYLAVGSPNNADPTPWFDVSAYRRTRMDARSGEPPLLHLVRMTLRAQAPIRAASPPAPPEPEPEPASPDPATAPSDVAQAPPAGSARPVRRTLDKMEMRALARTLASPLIDDTLYEAALGGARDDPETVETYASYPALERPSLTPFLDPIWYFSRYPEIRSRERDPLLHFLRVGLQKQLSPHPLIELALLQRRHADAFADRRPDEALADLLADNTVSPSPYFAAAHYLAQCGDNLDAAGSALRHYLTRGMAQGLTPNRFLDLGWYMQRDRARPQTPAGALRHFVLHGDPRGDAPGPEFDGAWYLGRYADVAEPGLSALRHYLAHGEAEGRQRAPVQRLPVPTRAPHGTDPVAGPALYAALRERHSARRRLVLATPPQSAIPPREAPPPPPPPPTACLVSVICGPGDADPAARAREIEGDAGDIGVEIIAAGRDPTAAIASATGGYVLLLAQGRRLGPGTLRLLCACLDADPGVAIAGPTLLDRDGRIEESGRAVGSDGRVAAIGHGAHQASRAYRRTRAVHAVSPAVMLARADLLARAGPTDWREAANSVRPCLAALDAGMTVACVGEAQARSSRSRAAAIADPLEEAREADAIAATWGDLLARLNATRVLAFYLPQYHPTVENDAWWGKGFTDWNNVTRAAPSYEGHYQPHVPADLGYYDLRVASVFADQARLAARYGIDGFCVYRYYLDGKRMLHAPFEAMLHDPSIRFPFCIAWANENWTRRWDGGDGEMLAAQLYDEATFAAVIGDAVRLARDPRYITVAGKPLFAVYRPLLIPDPPAFAARCRREFSDAGFPGVHLVGIESLEAASLGVSPESIGFDAAVEFPPQGRDIMATDRRTVVKDGWTGTRLDYAGTVIAFTEREIPPYPRHPGVFPSWDNTPRQPLGGISHDGADPALFQFYVEQKLDEVHRSALGEERLLFVNAWNEWAEGAHLEPDEAFGHRWLEAVRAARQGR